MSIDYMYLHYDVHMTFFSLSHGTIYGLYRYLFIMFIFHILINGQTLAKDKWRITLMMCIQVS